MRRNLILGLLLLPGVLAAQTQNVPTVTLKEARRRAQEVDPTVVAARNASETASWERRTSFMDLLTPTITAGTSYIHFTDPFFNFGTAAISSNATSATLQANYALLGAGKFSSLKRSRAAQASATANETAANYRSSFTTDAAYFSVLAERELAHVAADRLKRATEQLGIARVRVSAGEAIATDSLRLLLEVNRARIAVLRNDSALTVSRLRLGKLIGLSGPAEAAPMDSAVPPPLPITVDAAIAELRTSGPEVQAARAAERHAEARLGAEREGYLPDITVGAITGAYDAEFFPSALKRTQLALTVAWPIWDGGQRELAMARARADRNTARADRDERERAAAEAMAQAYNGYETARAGIELANVGVNVAREDFRVQQARYRAGATTILELLEAQVELSEAEASLVQARYSARLALAQIESMLGRRIFGSSED